MDQYDEAEALESLHREKAIKAARDAAGAGLQPTGRCHWCGDPVEAPQRFCSLECRDDWDRAAQRRHGR